MIAFQARRNSYEPQPAETTTVKVCKLNRRADGSVPYNHLDIAILALYGDGYSIHGTEQDEVH